MVVRNPEHGTQNSGLRIDWRGGVKKKRILRNKPKTEVRLPQKYVAMERCSVFKVQFGAATGIETPHDLSIAREERVPTG